jgi:hypothetical protein
VVPVNSWNTVTSRTVGVTTVTSGGGGAAISDCFWHPVAIDAKRTGEAHHRHLRTLRNLEVFMAQDSP